MGDKIGLTGLQISNGTIGSTKEKKILGWCWQNRSRLLMGSQYFLGLCVWLFVTTLEFCSQVCGTHTTCLTFLLSCGFSDFTKALSPWQGGQGPLQDLLPPRLSSLHLNHKWQVSDQRHLFSRCSPAPRIHQVYYKIFQTAYRNLAGAHRHDIS